MLRKASKKVVVLPQTISFLSQGKMISTKNKPIKPDSANFVIVCDYGDWSPFMTLGQCEARYPELEAMNRPNFYFMIEER